MSPTALAGRRVLVTRPAGQAARMAELIREAGGEPLLFPTLEIFDAADAPQLDALIARLESFDLAIFISANAVSKGLALVRARRAWPAGLRVATVGCGSARELRRQGFAEVLVPAARFDSEGLLELPELKQVEGKRVVIFRGEGGRELLRATLVERGAVVAYAECYRRGRPNADPAALLAWCAQGGIDAITVTSVEGVRNLHDMLGAAGRACLQKTPLFAPHERIAASARALGVQAVVLTAPGDAGLIAGLTDFFAKV